MVANKVKQISYLSIEMKADKPSVTIY